MINENNNTLKTTEEEKKDIETKIRNEVAVYAEKIEKIEFLHRSSNTLAVAVVDKR